MKYGSAAKSVLSDLDVIQALALRMCLGPVKTAPVCALQVGEMPLWLHRKRLIVKYWINIRGHNESPPTPRIIGRGVKYKEKVGKDIAKQININY